MKSKKYFPKINKMEIFIIVSLKNGLTWALINFWFKWSKCSKKSIKTVSAQSENKFTDTQSCTFIPYSDLTT